MRNNGRKARFLRRRSLVVLLNKYSEKNMQKSVLAEIVRSLSKKEQRDLNKWLQSPAHNQRQDVVKLFEFLAKHLTNGDSDVEKEQAWRAVFPAQPYDDAYMRQVMYFLLKAIEEYLVFTDICAEKGQFQLSLMHIYRERNLERAYHQAHRVGRDQMEKQPLRDSSYLFNKFLFEKDYSQLPNVIKNASANLQETSDALEKWFLAEKMYNANAMLAHRSTYKTAYYNEGMLNEVLSFVQSQNLQETPAIAAHYYAYMTIVHPEEEYYFNNFETMILEGNEQHFKKTELHDLYRSAINYCTAKVNKGNLDYSRRALRFFKRGVENGVLLENNVITRYTFGNAVAFALKAGEFDWATSFIEKFQDHLEEKERWSIVNFNNARILFERGDYDKAQGLLTQFEYDDVHLNIIAKTMLLKIYYEREGFDAYESLLESLRTYLQRKEVLDPTRKSAYKNMISLMKKLVQVDTYSKIQSAKFRETVLSTNPLMERDWLLEQLKK
jgi:hypothetical protein